jgi:hypothetical protein
MHVVFEPNNHIRYSVTNLAVERSSRTSSYSSKRRSKRISTILEGDVNRQHYSSRSALTDHHELQCVAWAASS